MYVVNFKVKYLVKFYLFKIILRLYQNHTPTLPKSYSDFTKITLRFYQNHCLIFTTSLADFHKITLRFFQNHTPIFPKSHSDFTKITLRLCQNRTPTVPKSPTDFHKITDWFSILKPQIVVLPYAVSKPHPHPSLSENSAEKICHRFFCDV